MGSLHPKILAFSEQEISPPSQNEFQATKGPALLLTNPHLNSRQGINCFCLTQTWRKGTLGEGSRSDQKGSVVGLRGIWNPHM